MIKLKAEDMRFIEDLKQRYNLSVRAEVALNHPIRNGLQGILVKLYDSIEADALLEYFLLYEIDNPVESLASRNSPISHLTELKVLDCLIFEAFFAAQSDSLEEWMKLNFMPIELKDETREILYSKAKSLMEQLFKIFTYRDLFRIKDYCLESMILSLKNWTE